MMILMPIFGRLLDRADYGAAQAIAALCPLVGALIWRALGWHADPPARAPWTPPPSLRFSTTYPSR